MWPLPPPPLPLDGVGDAPCDEGVGVWDDPVTGGTIGAPGGGPYCVLPENGCLGPVQDGGKGGPCGPFDGPPGCKKKEQIKEKYRLVQCRIVLKSYADICND